MGLFINHTDEIQEKVRENFGESDDYLVGMKYNGWKKGLAELIASSLVYVMDSSRTFLLYFSPKGIYEKEMSHSLKGEFILIPWEEIEEFHVKEKRNKECIEFLHLGKRVGYEINYGGAINRGNEERMRALKAKNWNRLS